MHLAFVSGTCAVLVGLAAAAPPGGATGGRTVRLDLERARVDGVDVLGRRPIHVLQRLGKPTSRREVAPRRRLILEYETGRTSFVRIVFRWRRDRYLGESLVVQGPDAQDVRLGRFLRLGGGAIQSRIAEQYGRTYELVRPFRCSEERCSGVFRRREGRWWLTFGRAPGGGRFVNLWVP